MVTEWSLTVDCEHPARLARFWAEALGYGEPAPPDGFGTWEAWFDHHGVPPEERGDSAYLADPDGTRPGISFLRVPERKAAKNRLHLDLRVSGGRALPGAVREPRIREAVERLVAAGARVVAEHPGPDGLDHVVLEDPEGNELCLV